MAAEHHDPVYRGAVHPDDGRRTVRRASAPRRCRSCGDHTAWVAHVDESIRGSTTWLAAIVACRCRRADNRAAIMAHRRRGQTRVHMAKSSERDRRAILATVSRLPIRLIDATATGKEVVARSAAWDALVPQLVAAQVRDVTIERLAGAEPRDRADIRRALVLIDAADTVRYRHIDAADDPALWIADACAWTVSRGGAWAAQLRPLRAAEGP